MSAPPRVDVAGIVERRRLSPFLRRLVLVSWIVTFFDGFDMNAIAFALPLRPQREHTSRSVVPD